jgi:hypothetical protein
LRSLLIQFNNAKKRDNSKDVICIRALIFDYIKKLIELNKKKKKINKRDDDWMPKGKK